ncbi:MAG: hypothetical protein EPN21_15670 [Methylococcaceae bacterium]|nr:MAG: hypothetical protein EPN21_15670 [Methylococcaceae bacterium]
MQRLYDFDHPYYCMPANSWFTGSEEYHHQYKSASAFIEKFGQSDTDLNLVFRWDWTNLDADKVGTFYVWWIVQRKGFMVSAEMPVTAADEPLLAEWLRGRWLKLCELWMPISEKMPGAWMITYKISRFGSWDFYTTFTKEHPVDFLETLNKDVFKGDPSSTAIISAFPIPEEIAEKRRRDCIDPYAIWFMHERGRGNING